MSIEEQETIILINQADMKEGFVKFSTTRKLDFERLCRRLGGRDKLLSVEESRQDGEVVAWTAKVPLSCYSKATFSIRKPRQGRKLPVNCAVVGRKTKGPYPDQGQEGDVTK